jgi:hypothetical protein
MARRAGQLRQDLGMVLPEQMPEVAILALALEGYLAPSEVDVEAGLDRLRQKDRRPTPGRWPHRSALISDRIQGLRTPFPRRNRV